MERTPGVPTLGIHSAHMGMGWPRASGLTVYAPGLKRLAQVGGDPLSGGDGLADFGCPGIQHFPATSEALLQHPRLLGHLGKNLSLMEPRAPLMEAGFSV